MKNILKQKKTVWTNHVRDKMRFYRLSEQRVLRILHSPGRVEEGVAPDTIAAMQPASVKNVGGKKKWSQEIWVMIEDAGSQRKIISAWRYPGMTKAGEPLPQVILDEIAANLDRQ